MRTMTSNPVLLWVTRTAPYHLLTAHRVRAIGHNAIAIPVLSVRSVAQNAVFARPDALVFTSANSVRHHQVRSRWLRLPVYAVGDHTAAAARHAGYLDVRSAQGDVSDLQRLIATTVPRPASIIHYSAREPAGDLVGYLLQSGFEATQIAVYETIPASDAEVSAALSAMAAIDGIIVHSPEGAQRVAELIAQTAWHGMIFCISDACADEFQQLGGLRVETSAEPTERSLMELLRIRRGSLLHRPSQLGSSSRLEGRAAALLSVGQTAANDNGAQPAQEREWPAAGAPEQPDDPPPTAA